MPPTPPNPPPPSQLARITERDPDSLAYHAALKRTLGPGAGLGGGGGAGGHHGGPAAGAKAAAAATRRMEVTAAVNRGVAR